MLAREAVAQPMAAHECAQTAAMLARAFRDNPGMVAVLNGDDASRRARARSPILLGFVAASHRYGTVEIVKQGEAVVAASLSFAPGRFPPPMGFELATAWAVARGRLARAHRFARWDHEVRRKHLRAPHFYLWFLGVEPERQGQGLGSELLRSLSSRADAAGLPCFLETDKQRNVGLYQNHGYRITSHDALPGIGTRVWWMQRG
jgi:ribosomal protein S18 acetylase RimI-like enzyme